MPPAKVKIEKIDGHRMRQNTFHKRKLGLIKKAIELTILCECDCAIILRPSASSEGSSFSSRDGRVVAYSNVNVQRMIQECWGDIGMQPQMANAEYAKLSKDAEAIQSVKEAAESAQKAMMAKAAPGGISGHPNANAMYAMMGSSEGVPNPMSMAQPFVPQSGGGSVVGASHIEGEMKGGGKGMAILHGSGQHPSFNALAANFVQWDASHNAHLFALNQQSMMGTGGQMLSKGHWQAPAAWSFGAPPRSQMPDLPAMEGGQVQGQGIAPGGGLQHGLGQFQSGNTGATAQSNSSKDGGVAGDGGNGNVNGVEGAHHQQQQSQQGGQQGEVQHQDYGKVSGGGSGDAGSSNAIGNGGGMAQQQNQQQMTSMFFQPILPQEAGPSDSQAQ